MNYKFVSGIVAASLTALLLLGAAGYFLLPFHPTTGYLVTPADHTLGSFTAPVTVIEYGAPSCMACARFNADVIPRLKKEYIDKGKVLYVFRPYVQRASDGAAEKIARCLPSAKYFSFLNLLFQNQSSWDREAGTPAQYAGLVRLGRLAGLTPARVDQCIGNTAQDADINRIALAGEQKYNLIGTPTFVVNGAPLSAGGASWENQRGAIEAILARK